MRLVKLEIKGFKSFAKETVLNFGADVIGVVGPNGSGKSNIVDAIRWVLGEQKKGELRLDKMSSVIFNGTKKRKASNAAQVFLTFDNDKGVLRSEFDQITIGRLLYRNGDSEYRLNGVPCRRKDITDLFVDTGIESNSYAIIALGMVDEILADKDNSRLRMLEQAAGISVYKVRKRETQNRLKRTQEDLDRIDDLLHELDANLKDLAKQAKRTRRHSELRERYRELSLDFAYVSSRELREEQARVTEQLGEADEQLAAKQAAQTELEERVEAAAKQLLTDEQHLSERRRQLGAVADKLRSAVSKRQLAEQRVDYLSQNAGKLGEQRTKLLTERERLTKSVETFRARLARAEEEDAAYGGEVEAALAALNEVKDNAESLRATAREEANQLARAEAALLAADRQQALLESRLEAARFEASAKARRKVAGEDRLLALREERDAAADRLATVATQLEKAEAEESSRAVREQQLRDELDAQRPVLQARRNERQQTQNELTLLQTLLERMEGSSEAVKYLANKHGWRDRYPQLADVLDVDADYRAAAEAVLAPVLSAFVVPDAATAAEGLRVLAEAKQPRTPILVAVGGVSAFGSKAPAGTRALREVVRCDAAYRELVDLLLEGVGVTSDSAAEVVLAPGQRAVDAGGRQVWRVYEALGGKTPKLQGQQTGRRRKVEQLAARVEELSSQVLELERKQSSAERELQELRAGAGAKAVKELRRRHIELDRLHVSAQAKVEGLEVQLQEAVGTDEQDRSAIADLEAALAAGHEERAPLLASRDAALAQRGAADAQADGVTGALSAASTEYNQANMRAIQLQNAVVAYGRELQFATDQLAEVTEALAESDAALSTDGSQVEELRAQIEELNARIAAGKQTRDAQQDQLQADEAAYYEQRNQQAAWEKELRTTQRESQDLAGLVTRLRERKAELGYRLSSLRERLQIEFNLDLDAATAQEREVTDTLAELEQKIAKLKHRLDNYGEINPLAVQAYEEMEERHGGIAGQREDVLQAMDSLRDTIEEIDRNATEKLREAFEAVRGHFVEVFRHLFDAEDTADMVMLDPENPLESKIQIVAKPKGKRPQTISQLSGGEKTLTATAFLFALYLIKPAPFCIFDEVDAPLDDSNVEKFNRIIKRFSADSQFIIVTHNKLTMAAVDTIYGVYMPELGVSSVTPVDFREFEHEDVLTMVG